MQCIPVKVPATTVRCRAMTETVEAYAHDVGVELWFQQDGATAHTHTHTQHKITTLEGHGLIIYCVSKKCSCHRCTTAGEARIQPEVSPFLPCTSPYFIS